MITEHKITTELRYSFPIHAKGERETVYPEVEITYSVLPGYPATFDDPGAAPDVEFISARIVKSDCADPDPSTLAELAEEWLDGEGRDAALENAAQDEKAAREQAMEYRAEARRDMERLSQ